MHLDEERLQRLLHGELDQAAAASAREHLAACPNCRLRMAEAEREENEIGVLLRTLDQPPPPIDAEAIAARVDAPVPSVVHEVAWGRWAAGFLLAVIIGGAAYAAPGSPLPALVDGVVQWIGGRSDETPTTPGPDQARDSDGGGIAVAPGQKLLIVFRSRQTAGTARVSLTAGALVVVRAEDGAATFTSDLDRLVIDNRGSSASFEIQIPRDAPRIEIQVNGDRVFVKEGPNISPAETQDSIGRYLLPLIPSEP